MEMVGKLRAAMDAKQALDPDYGMIFRAGPAVGAVLMGTLSEYLGLRLALALGAIGPVPSANIETLATSTCRSERGGGRAGAAALGLPAGAAEGSASHQFPVRGPTFSERALPDPGLPLLRVHRNEIAKSKWKFRKAGEDWFCFAGLWRPMPDGAGEAFTLLTTEPSPDVAPVHERQWSSSTARTGWPGSTSPGRNPSCFAQLPAGSLAVEQVR
jgi:hypothetical protein